MPQFSKASKERLATCDVRLQEICNEAIKEIDFMVSCGHRTKEDQDRAFANGVSKAQWPKSKHNSKPSLAVDLVPHPVNWQDLPAFERLAKVILRIAGEKGIKITWGGVWLHLRDYPHFEITSESN